MSDEMTTIYLCSDASLTYGPFGGTEKIIKQALPVCRVADPNEAETIITLVGQQEYRPESDPDYGGKPVPEGYGPKTRHRYTLENFRRGDVEKLFEVEKTLTQIRDALRAGSREDLIEAFEEARQGHGLLEKAVYEE